MSDATMTDHSRVMPEAVARAIQHVMNTVQYVEKKGENKHFDYKFAEIGGILAKVQPAMADAGLILLQNETAIAWSSDNASVIVTYEFFLSHISGASYSASVRQSGMATAKHKSGGPDDKALNKCHTAARKYFILGLFQIPTGLDADDEPSMPRKSVAKAKADKDFERLVEDFNGCHDVKELNACWSENKAFIKGVLPKGWEGNLQDEWLKRFNEIKEAEKASGKFVSGDDE